MPSLRLLGGVMVLLGVTAIVSPPVAAGLEAIGWENAFSRVYNRVFEVLLVLWLLVRRRQLGLGSAGAIGLRREGWRRDLLAGFAIGLAGLSAALVFCWIYGGLVPGLRYPEIDRVARNTAQGLASAVVVGAFEEIVFRGVLLRRLSLDFGKPLGLLLTTTLYGAVHLLHPRSATAHDALAGVRRTIEILAPLGDPANLPTFAALFVFGLLLAAARLRTGTLWMAIGIHAAWVAVFRVGRVYFRVRRHPAWLVGDGWPPLLGSATGGVAVAVTGALLAWCLARSRPRAC
jgi:membrane protease YdiL (CAAX protease family)